MSVDLGFEWIGFLCSSAESYGSPEQVGLGSTEQSTSKTYHRELRVVDWGRDPRDDMHNLSLYMKYFTRSDRY